MLRRLADLTPPVMQAATDERTWHRAVGYFEEGRVRIQEQTATRVQARVVGEQWYWVTLEVADGDWHATCTCPVGESGRLCKHVVATALTLQPAVQTEAETQRNEFDLIAEYLARWSEAELRERLLSLVKMDVKLADQLLFEAKLPQVNDRLSVRDFVREMATPGPFDSPEDYLPRIQRLKVWLAEEVTTPSAANIELLETAILAIEDGLQAFFDAGYSVWDREVCNVLQAQHLRFCQQNPAEAPAIAQRLFAYDQEERRRTFRDAYLCYEAALGEAGLAAYEARVDVALEALEVTQAYDVSLEKTKGWLLARRGGDNDQLLRLLE